MRLLAMSAACAAGVALLGWASPAVAQPAAGSTVVHCGQTLRSSVRLANDLRACPGDGLVIGADNITVDLAGHSIAGVNAAGSEGVADHGHRGARVVNGKIANFFLNGVGLHGAAHSAVLNLTIRTIGAGGTEGTASAGVLLDHSPHGLVAATTVVNDVSAYQSDGIDVLFSASSTMWLNRLADNAWDGAAVIGSPRTRVIDNELLGNQNQGIEVNLGSDDAVLFDNAARNNARSGLVVGALKGARIVHNALTGNGDNGLFVFDLHDSYVSDNQAGRNGVGIDVEGGQNGSSGNRVTDNTASRNDYAGIVVADGANGNTVVGNIANANLGDPGNGGGIVVYAATNNTVRSNVANRNRDTGIGVFEDQPGGAAGNVVTANTANFNQNHGMVVVDGTTDGGGNAARGNTPAPNCVGLVCMSR